MRITGRTSQWGIFSWPTCWLSASRGGAGTPCLVAPALPFGVADYFGSSPGGLALAPETFRRVLTDLLEGLLRHGLNRIVILNAHGGNVPVVHEVTLALRRRDGIVIPSFYLWKIARQLMEKQLGGGGRNSAMGRSRFCPSIWRCGQIACGLASCPSRAGRCSACG